MFIFFGGLKYEYLPDGDDPGAGWVRVTNKEGKIVRQVQRSRDEWDAFVRSMSD